MKVKKFEFEFSHESRKIKASSDAFKVPHHHRYPMYRVVVPRKKNNTDIYIFYEVISEDRQFFWYELEGTKEVIAKSIIRA